jgi:Ca2+/H+ antiporter, TMEM165/GDT1 family
LPRFSSVAIPNTAKKVPMTLVHGISAAIFAVLGIATLLNLGNFF